MAEMVDRVKGQAGISSPDFETADFVVSFLLRWNRRSCFTEHR